jgi:hypothetical protein
MGCRMSAHVAVPRLPTPDLCVHQVTTHGSNQLEAVGILYEEPAYTNLLHGSTRGRQHVLPTVPRTAPPKAYRFNNRLFGRPGARVQRMSWYLCSSLLEERKCTWRTWVSMQ